VIDHLIDGLGPDRALALGAVGFAGAAEQQPQIVLDLRHRADGGAGIVAGGFLVDRDRRRQPLDRIDVGLVDLAQELAGIGRQALDIAALPFSEDRVKGQGALAAAAHPREHHQPIAGDGEVDVLEIVLTGAPHPDHVLQGATTEAATSVQRSRLVVQREGRRLTPGTGAGRPLGGRGLGPGTGARAGHPASTSTFDLTRKQQSAAEGPPRSSSTRLGALGSRQPEGGGGLTNRCGGAFDRGPGFNSRERRPELEPIESTANQRRLLFPISSTVISPTSQGGRGNPEPK